MVKLILGCSSVILLGMVATASVAASERAVKPTPTPHITSVSPSPIGTARLQTITIKGTGFGTFGAYTGDSNFISLRELPPDGNSNDVLWEAGYSGPDHDTVTLIVKSWTNTEIVLGGFAGKWGTENFTLHKGDVELVRVKNWQSNPATSPWASFKVKIQ
jgi:hypothetical protein